MAITYFHPEMTLSQRVQAWDANADLLKELKKVEMEQRKALIAEVFDGKGEGTHRHELGAGYKLKTTLGDDTKLDEAAYALIAPELPDHIKDTCIKHKPSLVKKVYDSLTDEARELLDEAIVVKPKSPTLAIEQPKKKK